MFIVLEPGSAYILGQRCPPRSLLLIALDIVQLHKEIKNNVSTTNYGECAVAAPVWLCVSSVACDTLLNMDLHNGLSSAL